MTFPVSPSISKPLIWAYHYIDTNAVKEGKWRRATMGGESKENKRQLEKAKQQIKVGCKTKADGEQQVRRAAGETDKRR